MTRAIIFDFFGVLCPDLYWTWLKKTVPELESQRPYFQDLSNRLDLSQITLDEFVKILAEKTGISEKEVLPQIEKAINIDSGVVEIIKSLRANYKTALLSNAASPFVDEILAEHNLTGLFNVLVISGKVGFIKPDPRIFQLALEELGIKPEEAVFIDDRQRNTLAAEKLGIKALIFENAEKLKEDLVKLEIKI